MADSYLDLDAPDLKHVPLFNKLELLFERIFHVAKEQEENNESASQEGSETQDNLA